LRASDDVTVPPAGVLLRLLGFMVPCVLALSAAQPLIGAAAGEVRAGWAVRLAIPCLAGAVLIFVGGWLLARGRLPHPPWYSAWVLLPGAFVLAGAASMCILGALVEYPLIAPAMWMLLVSGAVLWSGALLVVRLASR
jgi:hypothetical protein